MALHINGLRTREWSREVLGTGKGGDRVMKSLDLAMGSSRHCGSSWLCEPGGQGRGAGGAAGTGRRRQEPPAASDVLETELERVLGRPGERMCPADDRSWVLAGGPCCDLDAQVQWGRSLVGVASRRKKDWRQEARGHSRGTWL